MSGKARNNINCQGCPAICCKNLAMEIGRPENKKEVEDLKWQLQFDTVRVYIRKNKWHQLVEGRCMHLSDDNFCLIYKDRPKICRRHNPPNCERYGDYYDIMLNDPVDLERYLSGRKKGIRKS